MDSKDCLIECGDHGLVPWHVVCQHLMIQRVPATSWCPVPLRSDDQRQVDNDWICAACAVVVALHPSGADAVSNMTVPACMNCVNFMKRRAGFIENRAGNLVRPRSAKGIKLAGLAAIERARAASLENDWQVVMVTTRGGRERVRVNAPYLTRHQLRRVAASFGLWIDRKGLLLHPLTQRPVAPDGGPR